MVPEFVFPGCPKVYNEKKDCEL